MEQKDIAHLAKLARIALTDEECRELTGDITNILAYVSVVQEIAGAQRMAKHVGPVHNVLRDDGEPTKGGTFTEAVLDAAPERDGRYIKVKKILGGS